MDLGSDGNSKVISYRMEARGRTRPKQMQNTYRLVINFIAPVKREASFALISFSGMAFNGTTT